MSAFIFELEFPLKGDDFLNAGKASDEIRLLLKNLNISPGVVGRIAMISYIAEMNVIIHAYRGYIKASIYPDRTELMILDTGLAADDGAMTRRDNYSNTPYCVQKAGFGLERGLAMIARYADTYSINSKVGQGTELSVMVRHI